MMSNQTQPNETENSSNLTNILKRLNVVQIRFCIARCETKTDKEAAEVIGVTPGVVKGWNDDGSKQLVDEAVRLMVYDGVITAQELRRRNLAKAMAIKVAGLDSVDEKTRQSVATEIIEWETGKATQPTDNKHSGDLNIVVTLKEQDE